jgi:hypothetical protein
VAACQFSLFYVVVFINRVAIKACKMRSDAAFNLSCFQALAQRSSSLETCRCCGSTPHRAKNASCQAIGLIAASSVKANGMCGEWEARRGLRTLRADSAMRLFCSSRLPISFSKAGQGRLLGQEPRLGRGLLLFAVLCTIVLSHPGIATVRLPHPTGWRTVLRRHRI